MDIPGQEVKIRGMTEADLHRVREIDESLYGEGRVLSWPTDVSTEWAMSVYRPVLSFVAQLGDDVVGFLLGDVRGAEYGGDTGGWIDMLGVSPGHQRRGVGRRLVEAFNAECQRSGLKPNVVIRRDDERLIRFFTSLGFHEGKLISFEG